MHNKNQVNETAAKRKRTDFLITSVIFCVFIAAAAIAIFLVRKSPVGIGVGVICLVWLIYSFTKQIKKFRASENEDTK